jgi:transcriptional regulator with XRE-family HTH domain
VPDKVTGPLVPRRQIATELRRLREERELRLEQVAEALLISTSKLSRLENAQGRPQARDIRDLIRFYEIEGTDLAARMTRWVRSAGRQGWWTDFSDDILKDLDVHLAYESEASVARLYTMPILPVLLQTPEYTRAYYRELEGRTDDEISELLDIRLKRQEALTSREDLPPLELIAVTHESSLRQQVGSEEIMRGQLDALIERTKAPHVRFHVLPFSVRPMFSMTCMYAHFEYADGGGAGVVHVETHAGFLSLESPVRVRRYRAAHDALVQAALSTEETRTLVASVRDRIGQNP